MCNLLLQHKVVILINQINLLILNHIIEMFINTTISHSLANIISILGPEFVLQSLHHLRLDTADDLENWSLGHDPAECSTLFIDGALFDVLVENLVVESLWALSSEFVWKLTTLWFDDVTFAG